MPWLLIDNSNTRTKFSLGDAEHLLPWREVLATADLTPAALETLLGGIDYDSVIICSVVPGKSTIFRTYFDGRCPVHFLDYNSPLGLEIDYPHPAQIGADRLANAAGVPTRHRVPAIVIDFGTAVTFDVISARPAYCGGVIAPGLGAMTLPLLQQLQPLTVIELDRDLAVRLRRHAGLTVIEADVLDVDFAQLATAAGRRLRVVGNLPYNISTPILFHLLPAAAHIIDQHFMLQKEVVERMAAAPGSKTYGRLSVMLQWRYDIEAVLDVSAQAFDPPPRVESAVVRMQPRPALADVDAALLGELVTVAFSQRRKLLRNTLGRWLEERSYSGNFDLQRRAEEVAVEEYLALCEGLGRSGQR